MLQDLTDEEEILKRAFEFFDKDGNGEISIPELRTTMHELGDLLSEEEIMAFMAVMDVNNDGVIGVSCDADLSREISATLHGHLHLSFPLSLHPSIIQTTPFAPPRLIPWFFCSLRSLREHSLKPVVHAMRSSKSSWTP
jgi:hypothetical protein